MSFFQTPPTLPDPFESDSTLRAYLKRRFSGADLKTVEGSLRKVSELAKGELYTLYMSDPGAEPTHTAWDAWGKRQDKIVLTPLWVRAKEVAAEHGIVATAYERKLGALSRVHQMALAYLFAPSTGYYGCPLAMTDGAAATLSKLEPQLPAGPARDRVASAVQHLTSRDPAAMWTSGQWMTERTGGSDVAISETIAKPRQDGSFGLFGTKWFTSAATSEMALTLARPEGNPPGGAGLALFFLEARKADGALADGIVVNRLKDKLGTKMLPTAELTLEGVQAHALWGPRDGIKSIAPMLNVTRTWNAVAAVSGMRRALSLAKAYAEVRVAFGARLADTPLHADTLAGLEALQMGAFHLAFRVVELLGEDEAGEGSAEALEASRKLARTLTPIAKLTTAKQAVELSSEAIEAFGGAGYIEDTGLPALLRDAQVLPIWEGTTNVLSLDVLRSLGRELDLGPISQESKRCLSGAPAALASVVVAVEGALGAVATCLEASRTNAAALPQNARRIALTLGYAMEVSLLVAQATYEHTEGLPARAAAAAERLAPRINHLAAGRPMHESTLLLG
jgi:acyl-CoA dehydrogenase